MKKEDLLSYDIYKQILCDSEILTEEELRKGYKELLESEDFPKVVMLVNKVLGIDDTKTEEKLKSVK